MEQVTVVLNMVFSFYLVTYESYIYVTALITHVYFFSLPSEELAISRCFH